MYAILSHGGRQYRVIAGDRLLVDRLEAEVGSVLALEPVLLTGGDGQTVLGKDVDGVRVAVTVVAHRRGRKLRIFKYKAKKRYRRMAGYRSDLTELRVESILAKGAALPRATTADGKPPAAEGSAATADTTAGRPARKARAARSTESKAPANAAESSTTAAAKPAAKAAATPAAKTAKRTAASTTAAAAPVEDSGAAKRASAKPRSAGRSSKAAPKTGKAAEDKETGDGA
jgi:large subunit ribosomal protein L21